MANIILTLKYWEGSSKLVKAVWIFVDLITIPFVLKIRWKISQIIIWITAILGMIQFIGWVVDK